MKRLSVIIAICLTFATSTVLHESDKCEFGLEAAKSSARAVSNLAVRLYHEIAKPGENAIFSPVSIALALALVESGAAGATKREIEALIGCHNSSQHDSTNLYQSLQHQLQIRGDMAKLSIANGLFYSQNLHLKMDYVNNVKQCFETEVSQEPFSTQAEQARQKINRWVSNATADKIPELFKPGSIGEDSLLVLANAVHMKAGWQNEFRNTEQLPFYHSGQTGQAKKVHFMVREAEYAHASDNAFDAVELVYIEAPLSMYIILPKERDGIAAVEKSLKGEQLISLFGKMAARQVSLKLPKFTIRQSMDLAMILTKLGQHQMFSDRADFSRMTNDGVKISGAMHEAFIKVNENGTEAAAATGLDLASLDAFEGPPVPFIADHPFIFVIVHKPTSAVIFMGRVNSILQQE